MDDKLLPLSNIGSSPEILLLKNQRNRLNYLISDLEKAISHPRLGEMGKSFV